MNEKQKQQKTGFKERFSYSDISFAQNKQGDLRVRGKIQNKTPIIYAEPTFKLTVYGPNDRTLATKTVKPGKLPSNGTQTFEVWFTDVKPANVVRYTLDFQHQ